MHGSRGKQKDLFSTSHQRAMSSCSLGIRASVHIGVAPDDKHLNNNCLSPLLLSLNFYCWTHGAACSVSWVSLGQLCWLGPLPTSCPPPAFGGWRSRLGAAWMNTKHSAARAAMGKINSIPARPSTRFYSLVDKREWHTGSKHFRLHCTSISSFSNPHSKMKTCLS